MLMMLMVALCFRYFGGSYSLSGFLSLDVRFPFVRPWIRIHASRLRGLVAFSRNVSVCCWDCNAYLQLKKMITHSMACRGDGSSVVKYGCSSTSDADGRLAGSY